jgi:hypothetical protein
MIGKDAGKMIFPAPQRYFATAFVTGTAAKVMRGRGGNHFPHILPLNGALMLQELVFILQTLVDGLLLAAATS